MQKERLQIYYVSTLQFLVLQFALEFLRLGNLPDGLVEIVLIDGVSVIFDSKQTSSERVSFCVS